MSLLKKMLLPALVLGVAGWVEAMPVKAGAASTAVPMTDVSPVTGPAANVAPVKHSKVWHKATAKKASKTSKHAPGKSTKHKVAAKSKKAAGKHAAKTSAKSKSKAKAKGHAKKTVHHKAAKKTTKPAQAAKKQSAKVIE